MKKYIYYIDPSFTRTGIFLRNDDEFFIFSIACLPQESIIKIVKGKEVSKKQNVKIVNYSDAYTFAENSVTDLFWILKAYPPSEINIEVPGIRGFKIERFLWGLSFLLVDFCLDFTDNVNYIEPNIVGNSQKKFLKEKEFADVKLDRKELKKLSRRGRADIVKTYCPEIYAGVKTADLNDDSATAVLFWFFQKEFNLVFKPVRGVRWS